VLYDDLAEIRRRYSGNAVLVRAAGELPEIPGVVHSMHQNGATLLNLAAGTTPQQVLAALVARDVLLEKFEIAVPPLDDIFIQVVGKEGG
jgi:ABC-2 type transport system ATP-binding protein